MKGSLQWMDKQVVVYAPQGHVNRILPCKGQGWWTQDTHPRETMPPSGSNHVNSYIPSAGLETRALVKGWGLKQASEVPYVHNWVSSGTSLMSGVKFNAALGVQAGTLPT